MKIVRFMIAASLVGFPAVASAQSNPFAPPQQGSGLSRDEIQEIARQEASRANTEPATEEAPPQPAQGSSVPPSLPSQPGAPSGSPVDGSGSTIPIAPVSMDPVEQLMSADGRFVGCIGKTPVFKDSKGRRIYFTTKELKESNEARRYIRC